MEATPYDHLLETRRGGVVGSRVIDRRRSEQIRAAPQMYSHSCSHHRRSGTSETFFERYIFIQLVSARSGDYPSLAANVGELEAHLYRLIFMTTQQHSTDASPVRNRSPPSSCNHTLHHTGRTAPLSTLSHDKFIFWCPSTSASARCYPHPPARFASTAPWRPLCRPSRRCTRRVRRIGVTRGDRRRYPDPRDIPRIARRRVGARRHLHLRRHQTHPRRRRTPRRFSSRASSPSPRPAARPRHPRTSAPSPTR